MVPTPTRPRMLHAAPSFLFALLLAAQAQAQSPTSPRPDPLDAKATVPLMRHASAFQQFRRLGDDRPVPWRDANDAVARIGGWRVYAREAQQPDAAASERPAAAAPASAPAPTRAPAAAPKQLPAAASHPH